MPLRHLITLIINAHLFSRHRRKKDDRLLALSPVGYLSALNTQPTQNKQHKHVCIQPHQARAPFKTQAVNGQTQTDH